MTPPRLFSEWRTGWRLRRGTAAYAAFISSEPDHADVDWLAAAATGGDTDRARWELRYARRALGLLVAVRDALDDRTGSMVARELAEALAVDRNVAAGMVRVAERQFNDRLSVYRAVLMDRSAGEGTGSRLGRALLEAASSERPVDERLIARGGEILSSYANGANEVLRKTFGSADLPEDQPPSSVAGRSRRS